MNADIALNGKPLRVTLSPAARRALDARDVPLLVELELYFSCLIRKRVRFRDLADGDTAVMVGDKLGVRFHPVMSQVCEVDHNPDGPPLTDFPIVGAGRFSPGWVEIRYHDGQWSGEFGY